MKKIYKASDKTYDSKFEEDFALMWETKSKIPIVHHHVVILSKSWEIDFAFIKPKIAIELQGHGRGHTSYLGMSRDYRKHNDLLIAGWTMLYFMSIDLKSDYIYKTITKVLESKNVGSNYTSPEVVTNPKISNPLLDAARRLQNQKPN